MKIPPADVGSASSTETERPKRFALRSIALAAASSLVATAAGVGGALATVVPAHAQSTVTVSTLTGETLSGGGSSSQTGNLLMQTCSYSVNGTALGPFPGTFTESGSWFDLKLSSFTAAFTIMSGTTTITGTKTAQTAGIGSSVNCSDLVSVADLVGVPYTATIHTPNGNFHDEGVSDVEVVGVLDEAVLTESFTSSLTQPVLIVPTSEEQCKHGGFQNFPQFKNQGQCVSFVEHQR